jgi:hypothetical protein
MNEQQAHVLTLVTAAMSPGETFNALRQEGYSEADSTKIVTDLIEEAQQWSDQLEANGYDVEQVLA